MIGELRIAASPDGSQEVVFDITASLGALQVHACFWEHATVFEQFGKKLAVFPQSPDEVVLSEVGMIQPGFYQHYLLLKAYCYDANGHSALKIIIHNNKVEPETQRVEFSILAEAASLNRLGNLLRNWQLSETPEVVWQPQTS